MNPCSLPHPNTIGEKIPRIFLNRYINSLTRMSFDRQRYIEIKFSIGARSHTKNLNYRTKILRMVQDLAIFERTGLFSTNALAERWGCELVTRAGDVL